MNHSMLRSIPMTFKMNFIYIETVRKICSNILSNNTNLPIVLRYIDPIWLVPTYLQCAAIITCVPIFIKIALTLTVCFALQQTVGQTDLVMLIRNVNIFFYGI